MKTTAQIWEEFHTEWETFLKEISHSEAEQEILIECLKLAQLLLIKNKAYGNSALDPLNIFSHANAVEQIRVSVDHKLSRLKWGSGVGDEDTILDLMGYMVLLRIAEKKEKAASFKVKKNVNSKNTDFGESLPSEGRMCQDCGKVSVTPEQAVCQTCLDKKGYGRSGPYARQSREFTSERRLDDDR